MCLPTGSASSDKAVKKSISCAANKIKISRLTNRQLPNDKNCDKIRELLTALSSEVVQTHQPMTKLLK